MWLVGFIYVAGAVLFLQRRSQNNEIITFILLETYEIFQLILNHILLIKFLQKLFKIFFMNLWAAWTSRAWWRWIWSYHIITEIIACILCMHLGACRFFTHPIALMNLKSILSKCIQLHFIFLAHTRMGSYWELL